MNGVTCIRPKRRPSVAVVNAQVTQRIASSVSLERLVLECPNSISGQIREEKCRCLAGALFTAHHAPLARREATSKQIEHDRLLTLLCALFLVGRFRISRSWRARKIKPQEAVRIALDAEFSWRGNQFRCAALGLERAINFGPGI